MLHFPFFEVAGTPYDLGRGHGESVREGIHGQLDEASFSLCHPLFNSPTASNNTLTPNPTLASDTRSSWP